MRVEYSEERKNAVPVRKKKKRHRLKPTFLIFLFLILAGTLVSLSLTVWFDVSEFSITGETSYTAEQIVSASGITVGDNLFRLSTDKAGRRIEQALPYIKTAEIKRSFPNKVKISVTETNEYAALKTDSGYAIVDPDFKILTVLEERPEGLMLINGVNTGNTVVGCSTEFSDGQQKSALKQLINLISAYSFNVTAIDVESMVGITFVIEDRLYIKLGSYSNIEGKIIHLDAMLKSMSDEVRGSISLTEWNEKNKKATLTYEDISVYLN